MNPKTNILKSVINIFLNNNLIIPNEENIFNKATSMGESLEIFIKNSFCNSFNKSEYERTEIYHKNFSFFGSRNHPPDIIIKNGDAIEIKKQQSFNAIALNSSHPKNKLSSESTLITEACKKCENNGDWEKDMVYIIGTILGKKLVSLFYVYGDLYAASNEYYQIIKDDIKNEFKNMPDIEFSETKELGKVKKIDPLGITNLRIRGMWQIEHPVKVYDYIPQINYANGQHIYCLIPKSKFLSFPEDDINEIEKIEQIKIFDIKVKDPDNPANLIETKLITLSLGIFDE